MFGTEWLRTNPDEKILVHAHPSRWLMIKQCLLSSFIAFNLLWLLFDEVTAGAEIGNFDVRLLIALSIPLCFVPVVIAQVRRMSVHYVITQQNVWAKKRILARDVNPTVLSRVQDVDYSQGYLDRLLNKGKVRIKTAGEGGTDLVMEEIPQPSRVAHLVREKIEEYDNQSSQKV